MKKLWIRLGATMSITEEEEAAIFCGDDEDAENAMTKILKDGRFEFDGESYIPDIAIMDFNERYGTDYCAEEISVEI